MPRCHGQLRFYLSGQMQWGGIMNENARTNMEKQGSERRGQTRAEGGAFSSELWKVVFSVVLDFSFVTEADEMMAAPILAPAFTPAQQRRRQSFRKIVPLPVNVS